jgi:hypothetical protein
MKQVEKEVLGYKVAFATYENIAEATKAAGGEQKVIDKLNDFLLYHGAFGKARTLIVKKINELTKVPFKMVDTGEKDAKGVAITERDPKDTDKIYANRALVGSKVTKEQVQDAIVAALKVSPLATNIAEAVRQPGKPPALPKKYAARAAQFLTGATNSKTNKPYSLSKLNELIKKTIGKEFAKVNDTPSSAENINALGWLIREVDMANDPTGGL